MADEGDTLAGFRGRPVSEIDAEGGLRDNVGPDNEHLVELFQLGEEARQFRMTRIGGYLLNAVERELADHMAALLAQDDLDTDEAKRAHFRARVAREVALMIDQACVAGRQAEAQLMDMDRGDRNER